ncbi:DMT family transporter [Janthinobacterium sp. 17J80-10]|nr:DMT family transporter [Janthinobacterium sp. 17J80-10]QAU36164.1 DMT family transporter [Janthinobacterium sp. 17J80-10]
MLFASLMFSIMGVCVKLASGWYSASEIVTFRGLFGAVAMASLIFLRGGSFRTRHPWGHLWRGAVGSTALWLWFYAIGKLPLATAMTLNYMSPIWIAAIVFGLAWRRAQQRFEWGVAGAIIISFIGVVMLLRPSIHAEQWTGGMMAVASSFLSALAYMQVRRLGQMGEADQLIVFYFSVTGMATGLLGMFFDAAIAGPAASAPAADPQVLPGLWLLLGVGLCATIAQMAMTRAYRLGRVLLTANLQYSGIVFASIWGILLWDDLLPAISWAGMGIILLSGIAATYYNARNTPPARTPAAGAADPIAAEM